MSRILAGVVFSLFVIGQAYAFDPITSAISKGISTAMDVRSKEDVKLDVEIDASLTKKLAEQKGDDFKNVSSLVFARHVVLVGFAKTDAAKRHAEELAGTDRRIRSLSNDIVVGNPGGGIAANALLDEKIDLKLKATKGGRSVNMRWKVYGGDVFLMGVAQTGSEADSAVRAVKGLDGVKTVHSRLRVGKK